MKSRNTPAGYIYCTGWKKFQHYHDRPMVWFKIHTDLLDNDEYRHLNHTDRSVLSSVWLLSARAGNGRVSADLNTISSQIGVRVRQLDALIQAGFITIRASKAAKPRYHGASQEKRRGYSNKKIAPKPSPTVVADTNGKHPEDRPLTREERQRESQDMLARIEAMKTIKPIDTA